MYYALISVIEQLRYTKRNISPKHVLSIMVPMARSFPQLWIIHVGGDDLLEAALPVLLLDELQQLVVDVGALGLEKAGARWQLVEKEELLLDAQLSVVTLSCLFLEKDHILDK